MRAPLHPLLPVLAALPAGLLAACATTVERDSVRPTWEALSQPTRPSMWLVESEDTLRLNFGDELVGELHYRATPVPYLWPLHAPGDVAVTRAWPMAEAPNEAQDHPHHRSFWLAHGDVNGVDFWHDGGPRPGKIEWTGRLLEKLDRKKEYLIGLEYAWKDPEGETLLVERRRMSFGAEAEVRWIDVESTFRTPLEEVTFGDTKEGTFALRMHPALRLKGDVARGHAVNSEGVTDGNVWGKRARWVHYQGPIDDQEVGIAIFDHPENLRHPTWWHARDYGLVAANPFGIHDFEGKPAGAGDFVLKRGESLVQRYRVWIHRGAKTPEEIEKQFAAYLEQLAR